MSKRNFVLLIIILVVIGAAALFGYWYMHPNTTGTNDTGGTNFISQFNPFSSNPPPKPPSTTTPPTDISGDITPGEGDVTQHAFTKVSTVPIAGFGVYQKERLVEVPPPAPAPEGSVTPPETPPAKNTKPAPPPTEFVPAVRYVDRATGNIYETFADKIEELRFTTTIIPKIYEAMFGAKAESVLMRYLKGQGTIETFLGTLPKEILGGDTTENNEVKGVYLAENISDTSISPTGTDLFYLLAGSSGITGTTQNIATGKKIQVFDSPYTEWLSQWPVANMITLTTKPSSGIPGYMYAINLVSKNFYRVFGGVSGLTTLTSPDGKSVLYADSALSMGIYKTDTKTVSSLAINTLPEKCAWNRMGDSIYCAVPVAIPSGQYPDSWYQGEVSFSDRIWRVDVATGNATIILDPVTAPSGEEVDAVKLALDEGENFLFFVNKKDSFLWEFKLR